MKRHILYMLPGGLTALTLLSAFFLTLPTANANVIDVVTVNVPGSCSLTSSVDSVHEAIVSAANYTPDIGITTISVFCNDPSGYAIYAIGFSNDEYGNTEMISNRNTTDPNDPTYNPAATNIVTGTAKSGNVSNWAMRLDPVTTAFVPAIHNGYAQYNSVPSTYTKVASFSTQMNEVVGESTLKTTYAVYISGNQGAGTYTGKVKYTLVHPSTDYAPPSPVVTDPGKISYNPNYGGIVDTMADQSTDDNYDPLAEGASVTLWASNFKRPGYGFAGWNTKFDYTGTNYGPNETITVGDLSKQGLSLYAIWVEPTGTLQGWNGCGNMAIGDVTALIDNRDDNVYAVAKLADGNCWMIENLRLGGESALNLNTNNTNATFTLPASTNTFSTETATTDIQMNASNTLSPVSNMTGPDGKIYSYGNYYSYVAAIGTTTVNNTKNNSATTSICPSGWHLPKSGDKNNESNNEFWKLVVTGLNNGTNPANYSSSATPYYTGTPEGVNISKLIRKYPNNFIYSGEFFGTHIMSLGRRGYYPSSTASGSNGFYRLGFTSGSVSPMQSGFRRNGFSVRCVAGS